MSEGHTKERLRELQALPFERKIGFTAARITEWYNHYNGQVYVSFSGGKDSTVLLHIARTLFPEIKAVFIDTGLEYPEIREFVKTFDNVDWIKPKMVFTEVIRKYGYPVIGKEVAGYVDLARKGNLWARIHLGFDNGVYVTKKGRKIKPNEGGKYDKSKWRFLMDAPFKISDRCCGIMKKGPAKEYSRRTKTYPMIATMTEESLLREKSWIQHGCNAFDLKDPHSNPMSFWTEQDVLRYIKLMGLKIASVYGDIVEMPDGKLSTTGCQRTGCVFCLFGIKSDRKPNRIQRLAVTHPALWNYCVFKLGLKDVMEYIGEPYMPEIDLFNYQQLKGRKNDD